MSSAFWAIKAAKNKDREFVPGTSKWVANELHLINTHVLTYAEKQYQEVSERIESMNEFMSLILSEQDDKQASLDVLLRDQALETNTPSSFTYISPSNKNQKELNDANKTISSPIKDRRHEYTAKTPSPLRKQPIRLLSSSGSNSFSNRHQQDTPEIAEEKGYDIDRKTEIKREDMDDVAPGLEDSFQAISKAIRKSIADKSLSMHRSKTKTHSFIEKAPENEALGPVQSTEPKAEKLSLLPTSTNNEVINSESASTIDINRKSFYSKTPKRSSIFVSLPSREPIPVVSSGKSTKSNRPTIIKSRTSRILDKLDTVSKQGEYGEFKPNSVDELSPIELQKNNLSSSSGFFRNNNSNNKAVNEGVPTKETNSNIELKKQENHKVFDDGRKSQEYNDPFQVNNNGKADQNDKSIFSRKANKYFKEEDERNIDSSYSVTSNLTDGANKVKRESNTLSTPKELSKNSADYIGTIESVLRRARNALLHTSQKINNHTKNERNELNSSNIPSFTSKPSQKAAQTSNGKPLLESKKGDVSPSKRTQMNSTKSPTRMRTSLAYKGPKILSRSRSGSPTRLTTGSLSRSPSRSPIRSSSKQSSIKRKKDEANNSANNPTSNPTNKEGGYVDHEQKALNSQSESDLINRLMTPTSSSAAKNSKILGSKTQSAIRSAEAKKAELFQSKNRFLTTTLNPSNVPVLNQIRPSASTKPSTNNVSPTKKSYNTHESANSKIPLKLESSSILNSKKKSLMAERSEAAAQKPKQKITIVMNHKLDLKSNNQGKLITPMKDDGSEKTNFDSTERNMNQDDIIKTPYTNISKKSVDVGSLFGSRKTNGNVANGSEDGKAFTSKSLESSTKRRKTAKETPSRLNTESKQKLLDKKASRISTSERRTPFKSKSEYILPQTPAKLQITDSLPDIATDDEDNQNKESKILQNWAHTPELHRLMIKNKDINPVSVFGEIPSLNIDEVFETQASRIRGNQSPSRWSPEEKKRKR